ncbi:MAG: DUF6089 family protein [Saprospiraceae bacterium]
MRHFLFCIVILLFSSIASAQQGWEIGLLGGATGYFGDLNTQVNITHPGAAGTAVARYNFNNRVSLRGSLMYGLIKGDDKWSKNSFESRRNLSFRSNIFEGALIGEFNFLPLTHGSNDESFSPYLLGGLCVFSYAPETKYNGKWVDLRPLGTEGQFLNNEYNTSSLGFLFGAGLKMDLTEKWSLNVELTGRKVFTDYLDDVSGNFADLRDVRRLHGDIAAALADRSVEPKIGTAGRQRGNGKNNDAYVTLSVGLVYYFGDLKCPSFYR